MNFASCLAFAQQAPTIDRTAFAFTHYDLQVTITPAEHQLAASGTVTLRNESKQPQRNVALQISSTLNWEAIELNGKPVQYLITPYTSDIDHSGELSEAVVALSAPVAPGATLEFTLRYNGTITQNSARLERVGAPPEVRARQDWDRIDADYTALRGAGFVVWYPVAMPAASISNGNEFADTLGEWSTREQQANLNLRLCHNEPAEGRLVAVTSGIDGGTGSGGGHEGHDSSCQDFRWLSLSLTAPSFALAAFQALDALPQFHIYYLTTATDGARSYAELAKGIEPMISDWFGRPRQNAAVVQLPETNWSAHESGATLFSPLPNSLSPQATQMTEVVLAHQLTHRSLPSPRPWIFEGAAHLAQVLERQHQGGRPAALQYLGDQLPLLQEAEKQVNANGHHGSSLINTTDDIYYRTKAMFCWWMLRDIVGDAPLQRAFAKYRTEEDRDPTYMQHLLEAEAHQQLDWFFNAWVYRDDGLPDFSITAVNARQNLTGGYTVAVTIENSGGSESEVPVSVRSDVSEAYARLRITAHSHATVRIQIGQYPLTAVVNDGSVPEANLENNTFKVPPKPES